MIIHGAPAWLWPNLPFLRVLGWPSHHHIVHEPSQHAVKFLKVFVTSGTLEEQGHTLHHFSTDTVDHNHLIDQKKNPLTKMANNGLYGDWAGGAAHLIKL